LEQTTQNLENELKRKNELKDVMENLQSKTVGIQEIIKTNEKQRTEELTKK
jgi:hypothetical protein